MNQVSPEVLAILKALQPPPQPFWVQAVDLAAKLVQTAAIVVGGIWAYLKFVKRREYRPRLELAVTGEVFTNGPSEYLIASVAVKNVGVSKVEIRQTGTALRVFGYSVAAPTGGPGADSATSDWNRVVTLAILERHAWIESGELIHDTALVALPQNSLAVKMELRVVANDLEWGARRIIGVAKQPGGATNAGTV